MRSEASCPRAPSPCVPRIRSDLDIFYSERLTRSEFSARQYAAQIQNYIRTNAGRGRDTEQVGPFLVTISPHTANPYLNYAIPDAGARPTRHEADALAKAFEQRDRKPRLEFLPSVAPAVEDALAQAGYVVDDRLPLMDCPPGAVVDQPVPDGIELLSPETDDEILSMLTVQHQVYDGISAARRRRDRPAPRRTRRRRAGRPGPRPRLRRTRRRRASATPCTTASANSPASPSPSVTAAAASRRR